MLSFFEILVVGLLIIIVIVLVVMAMIIQRTFAPTINQRLKMINDRAEFNIKLLSESHKQKVAKFSLSEAAIVSELERISYVGFTDEAAKKEEADKIDAEAKKVDKDSSRWGRFKDWIGKNKETLLGKINDIAKSAIGA